MFKGITNLVLILFFAISHAQSQDIKPNAKFLQDTLKIGVPVGFSLALRHNREMDVVFPDSLYDFSPYELDSKVYFSTVSDSVNSYDSAVYYITSFEIDSIQTFRLPIFILHGADSTTIYSNTDAIILDQLVSDIPDSVAVEAMPLKENTTYKVVDLQFNYPYFLVGAGILLILVILAVVIFGKRIKKYFRLKKLARSHQKFIDRYDAIVLGQNDATPKQAEQALLFWKKYLEKLEKRPYTKLTTKEIVQLYQTRDIEGSLKHMDRIIYGNRPNGDTIADYTALKNHADMEYLEKVEEVKNG